MKKPIKTGREPKNGINGNPERGEKVNRAPPGYSTDMRAANIAFHRFKGALLYALLFLYPFHQSAGACLEGIVVSADNCRPLDSVRVASVTDRTVTLTQRDGRFRLEDTTGRKCLPETTLVESFDKYTISISATNRRTAVISREQKPVAATLSDLRGRVVEWFVVNRPFMRLPGSKVPDGIYVLKMTGFDPLKLLVTDEFRRASLRIKQFTIINVRPPGYSHNDSIVFCKNGYASFIGSANEIRALPSIRLHRKKWIASDIHNHTVLTDGSFTLDDMLLHAFGEGGLDVLVNSEHGGYSERDTNGVAIIDKEDEYRIAPSIGNSSLIPRWYTLANYSWPKILGQRKRYPGKILLQGLEWDCPGHEHASVGFIDDADQPDAIAEFEYRFDSNDPDTSMPWLPKSNAYEHGNAVAALEWMKQNYPASCYCFINHPSRAGPDTYHVNHFRDFHNAAPGICLGLEGFPGHQKNNYRGSFSYDNYTTGEQTRTWGGADPIVAHIGGIWDALLGEGRHFWVIVNSDFHHDFADFWPGEYPKTWTTVSDTGARAWLDGLRSGDVFAVHGDLISSLDFSIDDGIRIVDMGGDLKTIRNELTLTIRFASPAVNNNGDSVRVDHIDLIAGSITGLIDSTDRQAYTNPFNPTARVIDRFTAADWTNENSRQVIRTTLTCTQPTYFRLRGTNLAVGTPGEVDSAGNPLIDDVDGWNTEEIAWKDLWFYSNPLFVYPGK